MSSKMKNINLIKILLDIVMSVFLVLMFNKNVISMNFHEIGGLFVCVLFLVHKLINWKWIVNVSKNIFSKDLAFKLRFGYIIDFLLLVAITSILVSGIFISKVVFTGISSPGGNWKIIHYASSALFLILVGIHIGLHWSFVMGMFKKYVKIPAAIAKPISIVLVIAVVLFGLYSMFTSSFSMWLTAPFTTNQMEGGPRPANADFQPDGANGGADSASAAPSQDGNASTDGVTPDQSGNADNSTKAAVSDSSTGNSSDNTIQPGSKSFNRGGAFNGNGMQAQDGHGFSGAGEHGERGGSSNVLNVILTFISIIGVFATITYYCEKFLRKRKVSQAIIQN